MPCALQILGDALLGAGVQGDVAKFLTLAVDPQVLDTSSLVDVSHQQLAELIASKRVIEEDREDRSIPLCFERRSLGCLEQAPCLGV